MNDTTRCGLWRERGRTVAVVVDTEGRCQRIAPPPDDESERCWAWLSASLTSEHGLTSSSPSLRRWPGAIRPCTRPAERHRALAHPRRTDDAIRYVASAVNEGSGSQRSLARIPDAAAWARTLRRQAPSNDDRRQLPLS